MITVVENPKLARLRDRMLQRDVTVAEVGEFITLQHPPQNGMVQQNLADFVTQQDLVNFWWLHDWWDPVTSKPATLPTPAIHQFCWFINHLPTAPAVSFNSALQQFYDRAVAHCKEAGLDVTAPGESAEERRKRRNRERMAKTRRGLAVPEKVLEGNLVLSAQVRGIEERITALKEESKVADAWHAEQVRGHQAAMMDASAKRKETAKQFKTSIENLRTEIAQLIAKQ